MTVLYDNISYNQQMLLDLPFREGIGIVTQDVAKPHHPITMVDTPTWTQLDNGLMVLTLNGTSEYLQCLAASCADLDFTSGDYSLGGWFYIASGGSDDKTLMSRFLLSDSGWELYHYINEILTLRHHHAAGASTRTGAYSNNWTFNKWWFMGFSRTGGEAQFCRGDKDSFEILTTTVTAGGLIDPETCNQNLLVGFDTGGFNYFNGKMWRPIVSGKYVTTTEWQARWKHEKGWFA